MLYRLRPDDGRIVDWQRMLHPDATTVNNLHALRYLRAAFEVLDMYSTAVHVPFAGVRGKAAENAQIPSLLSLLGRRLERAAEDHGEDGLTAADFTEHIDTVLLGLCNTVLVMLGDIRLSILAHTTTMGLPVPMLVEEFDGALIPSKVLAEIEAKTEELTAQLWDDERAQMNAERHTGADAATDTEEQEPWEV